KEAIVFASEHEHVWASIGVHPHDTKNGYDEVEKLAGTSEKIVAVGEIGLDYFYNHSSREVQIKALKEQIKVALTYDLPIIFHVREAFDDFWSVFDEYPGIRGELHSFTDTKENLATAVEKGLYIGVNGISTFTKDEAQKEMFDSIPLDSLLLETDAPFLTPAPFRGKVNEPAFVRNIAEYHANRRGISVDELASATTANAHKLFGI
ncbi:TatD family hydrolase, partial [Candidatus Saccharibacteria bacterium]|nr:TatD family hydrolase [Candidatus Saccharibacteria bacterium]